MGANDLPKEGLDLAVSRWGNSLAVRLPVALARELGVGEGDVLHVQSDAEGTWQLSATAPRAKLDKAEVMRRMREHLAKMPPTESVIREMRDSARY
jgi:antitoxin MazE